MKKVLQLSVISVILFLAACSNEKIDTNMSEKVADFVFTTQDNESFSLKDLDDDWWIGYFMYTHCTMVCPTTTPNMVDLQKQLANLDLDAQIVSFTVDPERDTPDVLKDYADDYHADLSNWTFLTGYDYEDVKELSEGSFRSALEDDGPSDMAFSHSYNFFLVNPDGKVIKKYDGLSKGVADDIREDIEAVQE